MNQQIVLFGGQSSAGVLNDTWLWDGQDWLSLKTKVSPPIEASLYPNLAYDPARKSIMLYTSYRKKVIVSDEEISITENSEVWVLLY